MLCTRLAGKFIFSGREATWKLYFEKGAKADGNFVAALSSKRRSTL